MSGIFSKILSRKDVQGPLKVPITCLSKIAIPKGFNHIDFKVRDATTGIVWNLGFSIRQSGHPKLVLSAGWLHFVAHRGLQPDDRVTFSLNEDEANKVPYIIRVQRKLSTLSGEEIWADLQPKNAKNNNNNNNNKKDVAASADDAVHSSTGNRARNRERKQGVPWTKEEQELFLLGLQKLGKGEWKGVSRNFVKTRTPTQVASYAKLYFNRQSNGRSSIFDITTDTSNDSRHQQMEDTDHTHLNAGLSLPLLSNAHEHVIDVDPNHVKHGTHMEDGWSQENNDSRHQMEDTNTQPHIELSLHLLSETQQSVNTNPSGMNHEIHQLEDGWGQKVNPEEIFVITNFSLELLSAVFDQLSSVHKPQYALISLLMSIIAMLFCIIELIHKGRKERVAWRRMRCSIPWFYNPSTNSHFGTFNDIIGLACAISQFILSTITYSFVLRNTDNPIKISAWPIIFAFGLLCSKFVKRLNRRTPSLIRDS